MSRQSPYPELEALQLRISRLPHLKQNLLMTYAVFGALERAVEMTAVELAEIVGVPPSHFSRARRELEAEGWMEFTHKEGQVKFYRLGEKATGRRVVVPLKRTGG
ncbi:winged helix-turn-helix domain-containing protein [Streptomyces sp. NPDC048255]|uniref:winged helix-turn-helix domain-containing protein n=1 Tax=Streptomyces sp. NPDC048255 TaxID=3154713 RepID=UPI0034103C10